MTTATLTQLAEAALRDRITTTFGMAGATPKGDSIIVRVLPPTPAEQAWMAACKPDTRVAPEAWAPRPAVSALARRIRSERKR